MAAPSGAAPALLVEDLNVWFGAADRSRANTESHVLKGINVSVRPGERLGLVGESGCGKTTTILAAMGLLPPSATVSGRVLLHGEDILTGGERTITPHRWTDIAMVFQGAMNSLNPVHTIGWQIAEAMLVHRTVPRPAITARIDELLDMVGIPAARRSSYPHELSGGMRQRAVIAMALACSPRVLLADEPTTALDVVIQKQILKLLSRLCAELDLALVLVTHDLGVVAETCDRAAVMLDGEIIEDGPVEQLYRAATQPYTRSLFAATPSLDGARPATAPTAPTALLQVQDLSVSYPVRRTLSDTLHRRPTGDITVVRRIGFEVAAGEMVALVGQSGCGKTTTAQSILGMVPGTQGQILLNGSSIAGLTGRALKSMRRRVQMVYQDPYESLDGRMRVRQILEEPLLVHRIGNAASRRATVASALERVGLGPAARYVDRYPHELSGGQRQRVCIASCLVLQPELLLADEPVSMLDVSLRIGILDLLDELRADGSLGILMITHDLSTAATYADRIIVMHEGVIVEHGPSWDVVNQPTHPYTRTLLDSVPNPDPTARSAV